MGLTKERTNIIKRISGAIGLNMATKGKKGVTSPKGKAGTKLKKKKTAVQNSVIDMNQGPMKQYEVTQIIPEPIFRYIPDRATI